MKNNKNIDRLFQERFKDFETEPNAQTWANIQAGLNEEKKERKIIPLWMKYTGIAAAFVLGFFAVNTVFKTNIDTTNKIVIDTKLGIPSTKRTDSIAVPINENKTTIDLKNSSKIATTNDQKTKNNENKTTTSQHTKNFFGKTPNQKTATVYIRKNNSSLEKENSNNETLNSDKILADKAPIKTAENAISQKKEKVLVNEKGDLATAKTESKKEFANQNSETNELEAILKQNEVKNNNIAGVEKSRWEITPNVAAMYVNSKSTSIDPQFDKNTKSTDNSTGFGIGVHYAISKKIALRTGINKFALGYNTNNVTYSSGLSMTSLANVDYTTKAMVELQTNASGNSLMTFEKNLQKTSTGTINQKMGYYEVPLEISYAIVDKKIGISLIGGISTLFLDENKVSLISSETNLKLGEANNLNAMHFSSNIGLGFKYNFVKSFQLNFEPMVKYQLNTFSNNSGTTKPVLIGLYSGISYRF